MPPDSTYDEDERKRKKHKYAKALGKRGGKARAAILSPERRAEIARKAANARWAKRNSPPEDK